MPARLSVYRFDPGAEFAGGLIGALERMEIGHETKLLDALFVMREPESGELEAIDLAAGRKGGTFAALLDFRLDAKRRRAISERTRADRADSMIEAVGAALEPGSAILAVLHTGAAPVALEEAVARCPGRVVADATVEADTLAQAGLSEIRL
jgi:hypothetical protein